MSSTAAMRDVPYYESAERSAPTLLFGLTSNEHVRFDMAKKSLQQLLNGVTVFGDYTVIGEGKDSPKNRYALCLCKCGAVKDVDVAKLRSGRSTCCKGCAAKSPKRITNLRHGMAGSAEYNAWSSMIDRCYREKSHNYQRYGGRGIKVCDRWKSSFDNFLSDMGLRPSPNHSIDRIDNDGDYRPDNCRWATPTQQQANRRVTRTAVYRGKEVPISELERKAGLPRGVMAARLDLGWSVERAMSEPGRNKRPTHFVFGEFLTTKQICERFGIERQAFNRRIRQGWAPEDAVNHYRKDRNDH